MNISDANKSGPFFSSKFSELSAAYPESPNSPFSLASIEPALEKVTEDLDNLSIDDGGKCYKRRTSDLYTPLPSSLDLQDLVSRSSRVQRELRNLLFMLDNTPDFLADGGKTTLAKRNSIQRHKNSSGLIGMDSVENSPQSDHYSPDSGWASPTRTVSYGSPHKTKLERKKAIARKKSKREVSGNPELRLNTSRHRSPSPEKLFSPRIPILERRRSLQKSNVNIRSSPTRIIFQDTDPIEYEDTLIKSSIND